MLFENIENNSEKRKNRQSMSYSSSDVSTTMNAFENVSANSGSDITPEWNAMKERIAKNIDFLSVPVDAKVSEKRFKNSLANHMVPKDTPERHRKNYALSNEALDSVVGDYYNNTLKNDFSKKREESKKRGRDEYMRYASVPGANPEEAFKASMHADDPVRVVDDTMAGIDDAELMKQVAPLASYGGYDAKDYVDKFVKPSLRNRMEKELVDENTPKSSAEYVMRSALDNSLFGKVGAMGMNSSKGAKNNRLLSAEGVANYGSNRFEDFVAGVGSLLVDTPVFSGLGSASSSLVGKATAKATERLADNVLSRYTGKLVSEEFANAVAGKVIKERLKNRIIQSATTQGLTLGGYDVANSVADDILYNGNVNVGKTAGSFAKGFAAGAAVGATGTALKARAKGLTGGKKLFSSAGVLSAESAVFTAGAELDKLAHGVEVKPIDLVNDFGESTATLLAMRMANWRPKGAAQKLDDDGKIKSELQLSNSERQELREMNVNPDEFIAMLEKEMRMPQLGSSDAKLLKENYAMLMSNKNLSASAKSKLMYLVENKITSTPPAVFDYEVSKSAKGLWHVKMLDAGGNVVERLRFSSPITAKSDMLLKRGGIRKNRIAYYENELTSGIDSQNFLREAGLYAKENSVDADVVAEAMYKRANNEALNSYEQKIMDNIMARSSAYESQINRALADARQEIEQRYNLDKGTLSYAVDKRFVDCSDKENKALDEYEAFVRSQVEQAKERTGAPSVDEAFNGYEPSNADRKYREVQEYRRIQEQRYAGQGGSESVPRENKVEPYKVPDNEPGKVWNIHGNDISEATVKEYEKYGKELSKKFGQDVVFITDEHQIEIPDAADTKAVYDYNNRLNALGWVHKGKVYINLPNISDMAELEKTMVHEVVGHAGLKKVFGNYMYDFLEDVYKTADGTVLTGIKKVAGNYKNFDMYTVTEEYLANLVEKAYPNAQERSLIVKFKDFVRGMLTRSNIFKSKYRRVSEEDLMSILKAHTRSILNRKERSGHRKDVFNRFASAHFNEEGYYDRDAYVRDKTAMAKEPSFSRFVPEKLIGAKYYVNYPYYPEDVRAEIVKHSKMSDKELREQSEGFNYRFEEMLAKRYKDAQKYIDIVDKVRKSSPFFEKNSQIEKAFEREFGVDIAKFKNMYPTYDDFLFHKLTGRNLSPVDNARRNATDNAVTGAKTEDTSRDGLAVIKTLDDLKKYFTGPLDVINGAMYDSRLGEPVRLKKVSDRLDRARMTPAEVADFDEALDNYAAMLLQEMMRGKKAPIDPYGYDTYSKNERARRQYIKEQAEEYRKKYGDESGLENEATGNQKN